METSSPVPDSRRWLVLAGYTLIAMSSQIVWLNFSGILSPQAEQIFNVGADPLGIMSAVWPIVFVPLSIPVGLVVDRWGFKRTVSVGALIIAVFSWTRLLAGSNFDMMFIFQSLAAVGQPFIYNGISKLAGNWFPKGEQTLANGIGTMGQIMGMIIALVLVPVMVPNPVYSELRSNLVVVSLIATLSFLLFFVTARESPSGTVINDNRTESVVSQMKYLLRIRNIIILMILFFIGVGIFSGLVQWIETILQSQNISSLDGGLVGAAMLISGIVGMVLISIISDRYSKLKQLVVINLVISSVFLFLFGLHGNVLYYTLIAVVIGFFLLSLAPLALQISLESSGEARAGTAAGMLWLLSQVGALTMIIIMPVIEGLQVSSNFYAENPWFTSILFLAILTVVGFFLSLTLDDTRNRKSV